MTLGDDITAALPELRAQAESRMRSTVTVERPDLTVPPDPLTGLPVLVPVYTGKARWKPPVYSRATPEAGGHEYTIQPAEWHFPVGAFLPAVGQIVTATAIPSHPQLVGRTFRVVAIGGGDDTTAMRLGVEEYPA